MPKERILVVDEHLDRAGFIALPNPTRFKVRVLRIPVVETRLPA